MASASPGSLVPARRLRPALTRLSWGGTSHTTETGRHQVVGDRLPRTRREPSIPIVAPRRRRPRRRSSRCVEAGAGRSRTSAPAMTVRRRRRRTPPERRPRGRSDPMRCLTGVTWRRPAAQDALLGRPGTGSMDAGRVARMIPPALEIDTFAGPGLARRVVPFPMANVGPRGARRDPRRYSTFPELNVPDLRPPRGDAGRPVPQPGARCVGRASTAPGGVHLPYVQARMDRRPDGEPSEPRLGRDGARRRPDR